MICIRLRFKVLTRRQCATFNLLPGEKSPFAGFDSEDKAITPAPGAMFFVRGAPGGRRRTALSPRGPGGLIRLLDEPLCGAGFFGGLGWSGDCCGRSGAHTRAFPVGDGTLSVGVNGSERTADWLPMVTDGY